MIKHESAFDIFQRLNIKDENKCELIKISVLFSGIARKGTVPSKVDSVPPKFAVLAFETMGLPSRE
jgi:hypothetical protein